MANDEQNPSLTDANGNAFLGMVDPGTGHFHALEAGTATPITGSPTSATTGRLVVELKDGGNATQGSQADAGYSGSGAATLVSLLKGLYAKLGSPTDSGTLITASGATTTQTGADQTNTNWRGVKVFLNTTSIGTGSITLAIEAKDTVGGGYVALLTGATVTTNTTAAYTVYPGITATTNVSASDLLPRTWRVKVTANNANASSYTVGATLLP